MFYRGLKKGTILYRKDDGGFIEISEIDYRITKYPLLNTRCTYKLIPIIGEWKYCYFDWKDSPKFTRNWSYVHNAICNESGYYPIGTDFDRVIKADIIYELDIYKKFLTNG